MIAIAGSRDGATSCSSTNATSRSRGLKHGDLVDISVVTDAGSKPGERVMRNLTAVAYNIAQGSIAAYYPEANVLVALDHYDVKSGTPSYKSTPVLLRASQSMNVSSADVKYLADWLRPPGNQIEMPRSTL